jgi:N-acetylmuramic acid 6-phosphate etherase
LVSNQPSEPADGDDMAVATTEQADASYRDLDLWSTPDIVSAIVAVQRQAIEAVATAAPALARAADALAERMRAGGRLAYVGAGSSGLLAQMDALELPGTYGIPLDRAPVLIAGGAEALRDIPSGAEDDAEAGAGAAAALSLTPADALVSLSASGRTPFVVAAQQQARERGALTIGIACNADTPLLLEADHPILLATPPEVVAGSTRMGAGTAQKCALNTLSTLVGIRLGHVYAGLMVNMQPDNEKLRRRAVGVVARAAGASEDEAARALSSAGDIKTAILLCSGVDGLAEARARLRRHGGDLRRALA